ncbi:response regulator [Candidatus Poriferisodalis sp.]|uniref:response regulator n=1 Tax=Candidatus Poriferisodalis sp. TaxID=3101277 RepID=UPI003B5C3D3C
MRGRILVAEDDPKQAGLIRVYLQQAGFAVVVSNTGSETLAQARRRQPDLVLLDIMMPGIDGLDVCRILRRESQVPIVMLTARSAEHDMLHGLELGADDYIVKPFSPRELVVRVKAILRRAGRADAPSELAVRGLHIDLDRHEVTRDGLSVDCTPREFAILVALAKRPGRVFSRTGLLEAALGFDYEGLERTIDVHVGNLRKKLEPDPTNPSYIVTVFGVGYKLDDSGSP